MTGRLFAMLLLFAAVGCDRSPPPSPLASTSTTGSGDSGAAATPAVNKSPRSVTLDGAMEILVEPHTIVSPDGVYVFGEGGVWLLRGTQAVRVNEVSQFTQGAK